MQYKLKNWLARGWELDGYGEGREKVPGWGGSKTKNTALVGSPQKDCCRLGVLWMTSVWCLEVEASKEKVGGKGCPEQHWRVLAGGMGGVRPGREQESPRLRRCG